MNCCVRLLHLLPILIKFRNWPSLTVSWFGRCCQQHSETSTFLSHRTAVPLYILFSQSVFAHTTSAISYCPISDRYLPANVILRDKIIYFLWKFSHRYCPKPSFVCSFYMKVLCTCVRIIATNHNYLLYVCLSVRIFSGNKSAPTVWIFITFGEIFSDN
jgi:hypothetical protein